MMTLLISITRSHEFFDSFPSGIKNSKALAKVLEGKA